MVQVVGPATWPKPDWLVKAPHDRAKLQRLQDKATSWSIEQQIQAGVDVFTDGGQRRESLMWHVIQNGLNGVDFELRTLKPRKGCEDFVEVPTVNKRLTSKKLGFLVEDFQFLHRKVKKHGRTMMVVPGPMTVVDSLCGTVQFSDDCPYRSEKEFAMDVARILSKEFQSLVDAGCDCLAVDEPAFCLYPEKVSLWGVQALDACFEGIDVERVLTFLLYQLQRP